MTRKVAGHIAPGPSGTRLARTPRTLEVSFTGRDLVAELVRRTTPADDATAARVPPPIGPTRRRRPSP